MLRPLPAFVASLMLLAGSAHAQHPCAADARARAVNLMALHTETAAGEAAGSGSIGDDVRQLKPIKALAGKGRFDVLELEGYVYKATYRMHFIYAQINGSCLLMGQEIIEVADPY
jgi:hypothetical protein